MPKSAAAKAGEAISPKRFVLTFQSGAAKGRQLTAFNSMGSKADCCKADDLTIADSEAIRSDARVRLKGFAREISGRAKA